MIDKPVVMHTLSERSNGFAINRYVGKFNGFHDDYMTIQLLVIDNVPKCTLIIRHATQEKRYGYTIHNRIEHDVPMEIANSIDWTNHAYGYKLIQGCWIGQVTKGNPYKNTVDLHIFRDLGVNNVR